MKANKLPKRFKNNDDSDGQTFLATERIIYWASEQGYITRTFRKSLKEHYVKPYIKDGKATVKINGKEIVLKNLIARLFNKEYKEGDSVICIDGDLWNCTAVNLKVYKKRELGKRTGWMSKSKAVLVGEGLEFRSVRAAAKHLFCSYQTLLDYLNGKVKKSVLADISVRYIGGYYENI